MKTKSLNPKNKVRDTAKEATSQVAADQQNACCDCKGPMDCFPPGCYPPGCCGQ